MKNKIKKLTILFSVLVVGSVSRGHANEWELIFVDSPKSEQTTILEQIEEIKQFDGGTKTEELEKKISNLIKINELYPFDERVKYSTNCALTKILEEKYNNIANILNGIFRENYFKFRKYVKLVIYRKNREGMLKQYSREINQTINDTILKKLNDFEFVKRLNFINKLPIKNPKNIYEIKKKFNYLKKEFDNLIKKLIELQGKVQQTILELVARKSSEYRKTILQKNKMENNSERECDDMLCCDSYYYNHGNNQSEISVELTKLLKETKKSFNTYSVSELLEVKESLYLYLGLINKTNKVLIKETVDVIQLIVTELEKRNINLNCEKNAKQNSNSYVKKVEEEQQMDITDDFFLSREVVDFNQTIFNEIQAQRDIAEKGINFYNDDFLTKRLNGLRILYTTASKRDTIQDQFNTVKELKKYIDIYEKEIKKREQRIIENNLFVTTVDRKCDDFLAEVASANNKDSIDQIHNRFNSFCNSSVKNNKFKKEVSSIIIKTKREFQAKSRELKNMPNKLSSKQKQTSFKGISKNKLKARKKKKETLEASKKPIEKLIKEEVKNAKENNNRAGQSISDYRKAAEAKFIKVNNTQQNESVTNNNTNATSNNNTNAQNLVNNSSLLNLGNKFNLLNSGSNLNLELMKKDYPYLFVVVKMEFIDAHYKGENRVKEKIKFFNDFKKDGIALLENKIRCIGSLLEKLPREKKYEALAWELWKCYSKIYKRHAELAFANFNKNKDEMQVIESKIAYLSDLLFSKQYATVKEFAQQLIAELRLKGQEKYKEYISSLDGIVAKAMQYVL